MARKELEWKLECRKQETRPTAKEKRRRNEMAMKNQVEVAKLEHEILDQVSSEGKASNSEIRVKPWRKGWPITAGAYPGFRSMKRLEVFLLPLDGMQVHRRSLPRNRPLSHGGHFESQENKKLCFCASSLALDEKLHGQNLLFQQCVIKFYFARFPQQFNGTHLYTWVEKRHCESKVQGCQ